MRKRQLLLSELQGISDPLLDEVIDFIHFLKLKMVRDRIDTAVASESSLRKEWAKPEEDEAWRNL